MLKFMIDVCLIANLSALATLVGAFCLETLRDV